HRAGDRSVAGDRTVSAGLYTLSLHDALPIYRVVGQRPVPGEGVAVVVDDIGVRDRAAVADAGLARRLGQADGAGVTGHGRRLRGDRKSTRLNFSHDESAYAVGRGAGDRAGGG